MRQLFWSCILTTIMLVGLFNFATPIVYHVKEYPHSVHKTIYVDRFMADDEMDKVIQASIEWHQATGGIVTFDVKRLPQQSIDATSSILMIEVTPDYPEIVLLDNLNQNTTLGYFNDRLGIPYIALVDSRLTDDDFKAVVLHELGHSLGLEHNMGVDGIGTLMYPTIDLGADHITNVDIDHFCTLYLCNPKELHN